MHRQRVHVAPQQDRRAGLGAVEGCDHARGALTGADRHPEPVERLQHPLLRERQLQAELRVLVEGAAEPHRLTLELLGLGEQRVRRHGRMVRPRPPRAARRPDPAREGRGGCAAGRAVGHADRP